MKIENFVNSLNFEKAPILYRYDYCGTPVAFKFVGASFRPSISEPDPSILFLRADNGKTERIGTLSMTSRTDPFYAHLDKKTGKLSDPLECEDRASLSILVKKWIVDFYNHETDQKRGEAEYDDKYNIVFKVYQWVHNEVRETLIRITRLDVRVTKEGVRWGTNGEALSFSFTDAPHSLGKTYPTKEECLADNKITYFTFDDEEENEESDKLKSLKQELKDLRDKAKDVEDKISEIVND